MLRFAAKSVICSIFAPTKPDHIFSAGQKKLIKQQKP